jgi:hypothetical protein
MTLSMSFTREGTLIIPRGLKWNAMSRWHSRRVVLKPRILDLAIGGELRGLKENIDGVVFSDRLFPRLETCICLLHIRIPWGCRSQIRRKEEIVMKEKLAEFVAAFLRFGSGKRKLIRLRLDDATGPLVTIGHHVVLRVANSGLASRDFGDGKDVFALRAERIVQQAYVFPKVLTWW